MNNIFNFTLRYVGKTPIVVTVHGAQDGCQARQALRNAYHTALATISSLATPASHATEHLHIEDEAVEVLSDADRAADAWYAELLQGDSADRGV